MAIDLLFGRSRRNWARGSRRLVLSAPVPAPESVSDEVTDKFTENEMVFVAKLAELKAKAEGGDKTAKRQYARLPKNIALLKAKAKKGDPKAKRLLSVIDKSGLFNPSQTLVITSGGNCSDRGMNPPVIDVRGEFIGEEAAALAWDGGSAEKAALSRFMLKPGNYARTPLRGRCEGGCECGSAIPNTNYRMAVYRQAVRQSNGKRPTTKDLFLAKSKVDQVIGKAGISLYLPGAKPGRRTV